MGLPGKSGKQGIMGQAGLKGDVGVKGQKGDMGPAGMPGAKGEPGESVSAPAVAVSPKTLTVNEGGSASFQCSVNGNPKPVIKWSKLNSLSQMNPSTVSGGKLLLKNVAGDDAGKYNCSAVNILGKAHALVQLVVNGKFVVTRVIVWIVFCCLKIINILLKNIYILLFFPQRYTYLRHVPFLVGKKKPDN